LTWIKESRKDSSPVGEIKKLRAVGAATFGSNFLISYIGTDALKMTLIAWCHAIGHHIASALHLH